MSATRLEPGIYVIKPHPSERVGPIRADEENGRIRTSAPIGFENPKALWRVSEVTVGNAQTITNVAFKQPIGVYKGVKIPEDPDYLVLTQEEFGNLFVIEPVPWSEDVPLYNVFTYIDIGTDSRAWATCGNNDVEYANIIVEKPEPGVFKQQFLFQRSHLPVDE